MKSTSTLTKNTKTQKVQTLQKLLLGAIMSTMIMSSMQSPVSAQLASGPNDPLYTSGDQWALGLYRMPQAVRRASGRGVSVAILSNGVDANHADLSGKVQTLGTNTSAPTQMDGTNMALLIAGRANNSVGGTGIAPDANIISIKTTNPDGSRNVDAFVSGIDEAARAGARILVLDFRRFMRNEFGYSDLQRVNTALQNFHDNHHGLIFMPSGDEGMRDNNQSRFPHIIVVSGFDRTLNPRPSNTGSAIVFSANKTGPGWSNNPTPFSATKFAAAEAAGVAALVWSYNLGMSNTQIEEILTKTATPPNPTVPWDANYGFGIPNAEAAINLAPVPQPILQNRMILDQRFGQFRNAVHL